MISPFIKNQLTKLTNSIDSKEMRKLQDEFWELVKIHDYPLKEEIEETNEFGLDPTVYEYVTFLYKTKINVENVFILAEFNHVTPNEYIFKTIENTNIYYKTFILPKGSQAEYRIITNDPLDGIFAGAKLKNRYSKLSEHPDHLSSHLRVFKDGFSSGKDYILARLRPIGEYYRQFVRNMNESERGQIVSHEFSGAEFEYDHKIQVYLPPAYDPQGSYKFIVVHDGSSFLTVGETNVILDHLVNKRLIEPVIGIFLDAGNVDGKTMRYEEYPGNLKFAKMVMIEMISHIRKMYPISEIPADGIMIGSSYGGIAAFYLCFKYPEIISNVLSLSGSFHYGENDEFELIPKQVAFSERVDINIYAEVGRLEGEYHWNLPTWPNQLVSHRHFMTILEMKKYNFTYHEYNGDHSHSSWIEAMIRGLLFFLNRAEYEQLVK